MLFDFFDILRQQYNIEYGIYSLGNHHSCQIGADAMFGDAEYNADNND